MAVFNEDTRVKIPATVQFLRLGYDYQSLREIDLHTETRIERVRFARAISRINGRDYTDAEILSIIEEIHLAIRNEDLGKTFYKWLTNPQDKPKLIDFDNPDNNDFAVVDELTFGKEGTENDKEGSFRPDITLLVNGIPLAFLEVKHPDNEGGIKAEFDRMLNKRLEKPEYRKYFNMLQIVSFSNNMEYEDDDDMADAEEVKAGSFYTTPNGMKTSFSFFREEDPKTDGFIDVGLDKVKAILKDNHYSPTEAEAPEFYTNLDPETPCNRFVTSMFAKDRLLYFLQYGIVYVDGEHSEKHIMRYPQFFASKALIKRIDSGGKSGIIWHTQGSGKTALAAMATRILRDYYAARNTTARVYYVVDRLDLLTQVSREMSKRGLSVTNVNSKADFEQELNRPISNRLASGTDGEITVVNIQKFDDDLPAARNVYGAKIQRIIFVDEAHRSYKTDGEFFKNLMLVDVDAIYVALTGTPLLSKKERSNLKFGDYIHKYFYDKSIADGYTLRIKKEAIETTERTEIKKNLNFDEVGYSKADIYESADYINALCKYIEKDFRYFRLTNADDTIGGMVVSSSNRQARLIKQWFDNNSEITAGLVISDADIAPTNKQLQISFKETLQPDMLVVHQMLTTGYDVNRLKKMYLLRNAKEHTLLQTISRVNRPYKSPKGKVYRYGYIVDFVDIEAEYDRTIEMYLKELEADLNGETGEGATLTGLIIGPEDINAKYKAYAENLAKILDTGNLELFSRSLALLTKDVLYQVRRMLNGIKSCYTEFKLSRAEDYAAQIDIEHIRRLLKLVQARIDFINLKTNPVGLLAVISNKEVVEIVYEFLKVRVDILNLGALTSVASKEELETLTGLIEDVQNEIKKNQNRNAASMIKLDEVLQKLFESLDITNLDEISDELRAILEEVRRINRENERLAARYDGKYAFVKTFTDATEVHPEYDREDIARVLDIVFESVKEIESANVLILQGRDNFIASIKNKTIPLLVRAKLYKGLNLKEWYNDILSETYSNMKIF